MTIMLLISCIILLSLNKFLKFNIEIIFIIIANSFFMNIFNLQLNDFRCNEKLGRYNIFKIMNAIIKIILVVFLYRISTTPMSYLIATALSFIILSGKYFINNFKIVFNKDLFINTINFGLPLVGTSVGYLLLSSFDRYMISFIRGNIEVSYYAFAYQISELALININALLMVIFYPLILKTFDREGAKSTEVLISKLFNYNMLIVFAVTNLLIIFSKDLTHLFFKNYIGTENYIMLIAIGVFIYCTSFYTNKAFEVSKKTKSLLWITITSGLINMILNLICIPKYGAISAAFTTIISYCIYIILSLIKGRKYLKIKIDKIFILKIMLIWIIIWILFSVISMYINDYTFINLLIKVGIITIVYLLLLLILNISKHIKLSK